MRAISIHHVNLLLALSLLTTSIEAKQSDYQQPIQVDSQRQLAELGSDKVSFLDDVVITQGSIRITASKVEVIRHGQKGAEEMIAYGSPATFYQILDNGKPVEAQAKQLSYKLKEKLVILSGKAHLKQEDSQVSGDTIRYDIQKQQMAAESSGKGSRVKTIFLPDQIQEQVNDQKKGQQ
ncbi:lipopolysaccharide transport periplasmic protein LptA [Pseudaeromonas sharmana]|uniref:Lipopolysaccharide export system protein LptA n=1 Tax=Pseudaeromonas sharmana TaxID=328412 RepID=A0ABV8CPK1_9GAMM